MYIYFLQITAHIRKELWKSVNIKYFRETKCLVDYNDISVREPGVSFFPFTFYI